MFIYIDNSSHSTRTISNLIRVHRTNYDVRVDVVGVVITQQFHNGLTHEGVEASDEILGLQLMLSRDGDTRRHIN
jgi:ribosomal protein S19